MRPILQIMGHTWWLHFLPQQWKARVIAENVRLDYGGNYPGVGVEMQLNDGSAWTFLPVEGVEPPPKGLFRGRFQNPLLKLLARPLDWLLQWSVEIRRMLGVGKFARWEPVKLNVPGRVGGPL